MTSLNPPPNSAAYRDAIDANLARLRASTPDHVTLTRVQIARQTGLNPRSVRSIEKRGLAKLREALGHNFRPLLSAFGRTNSPA